MRLVFMSSVTAMTPRRTISVTTGSATCGLLDGRLVTVVRSLLSIARRRHDRFHLRDKLFWRRERVIDELLQRGGGPIGDIDLKAPRLRPEFGVCMNGREGRSQHIDALLRHGGRRKVG